jgi:hypothetical protein
MVHKKCHEALELLLPSKGLDWQQFTGDDRCALIRRGSWGVSAFRDDWQRFLRMTSA